jgi:hypothetical protein
MYVMIGEEIPDSEIFHQNKTHRKSTYHHSVLNHIAILQTLFRIMTPKSNIFRSKSAVPQYDKV